MKYCPKLFTWLEVQPDGTCHLCCPAWLPYPIGNILDNDFVGNVWNGPTAQELRGQIHKNDWNYCNAKLCPAIASSSLKDIININDDATISNSIKTVIQSGTIIIDDLPSIINFSNDRSCNLKCPSCRSSKIMISNGKEYDLLLEVNQKIIELFLNTPSERHFKINVTGSGDPFASKIYSEMLFNIDGNDFPNLKIDLLTNGIMFTEKTWNKLSKIHSNLDNCRISFDAGSRHTYKNITRLGGKWDILLKNCMFLDKTKMKIHYDFVVQQANFKEMKSFISLVQTTFPNFASIHFSMLNNWGTWNEEEFNSINVCDTRHAQHTELMEIIEDPIFNKNNIYLGNLSSLYQTNHQ